MSERSGDDTELTKDNVAHRSGLQILSHQYDGIYIPAAIVFLGCILSTFDPGLMSGPHLAPKATHPVDHTKVLLKGKCFKSYPAKALISEVICYRVFAVLSLRDS